MGNATPTALRKARSVLTGTSFADNTTGAITAQMVRQFTESGMGGFATIYSPAGTPASQAVASGATAVVVTSIVAGFPEPPPFLNLVLCLHLFLFQST